MNNFDKQMDDFNSKELILKLIKEKNSDVEISLTGDSYSVSAMLFGVMVEDKTVADIICASAEAYNKFKVSLN